MLYWHTALLSHHRSSSVSAANCIPIYPKLTILYYSPLSFCSSSVSFFSLLFLSLVVWVRLLFYFLSSVYVFFSLWHSPLSASLLLSSWLRGCSPCTPWQCGSCLNSTRRMLACVPWPSCSAMLKGNCAPSSVLLMKRSVYGGSVFEHLLWGHYNIYQYT